MAKPKEESKLYYLECGHKRRLKDSTAKRGTVFCWACDKQVKLTWSSDAS